MKSGTSSLFRYLGQHPEVCLSKPKEINFFSNQEPETKTIADYQKLWRPNKNHTVLLEGSTNYSKHPAFPGVPKAINDYQIDPYLIYIVRNPIDRLVSHYNHSILRNRKIEILDQYLVNVSSYHLQLAQYRKYFNKEKIHIVDFHEMVADTQRTVSRIFNFMNLKDCPIQADKVHNKTRKKLFQFKKTKPTMKSADLSSEQYSELQDRLEPDMIKFGEEYEFDIKKWGF